MYCFCNIFHTSSKSQYFVLSGCLVFVCLSLVEGAVVTYFSNPMTSSNESSNERFDRIENLILKLNCLETSVSDVPRECEEVTPIKTGRKHRTLKPHILHKISRVLFPIMFLMFNMVYWSYYLELM